MTEETIPHVQNETTSTPSQDIFTIESSASSSEQSTFSDSTDFTTYIQWLNVYSSNTMNIMVIGREMAVDFMQRVRNVMHYLRDDSLAVNLIKYKDYVITSLIKRPEREEFLAEDIILVIINILAFIYSLVADIGVCFIYYHEGEPLYAFVTLAILVIPLIISNSVSMYFYKNTDHECSVEPILLQHSNRCSKPVAWVLCSITHFLLLGQVYRSILLIYVGMKSWGEERIRTQMRTEALGATVQQQQMQSDDARTLGSQNFSGTSALGQSKENSTSEFVHPCIDYYALYVHQEFDVAVMEVINAFLHDGTQVILQLYLILAAKEDVHWRKVAQIQSAVMSLVGLSWCYSEYTRAKRSSSLNKIKLNLLGMLVQFLWRLFTLISRIFAFALFATKYRAFIVCVIVGHWLLMTIWVHLQHRTTTDQSQQPLTFWEMLRNFVIGYIYVFCFFNTKDEPTRLKYLLFYTLVFVENQALLLAWYFKATDYKFALPVFFGLTGCFIVGIMFMSLYYSCIHPNKELPNRSQPAKFL